MKRKNGKFMIAVIVVLVVILSAILGGFAFVQSKLNKMNYIELDESDLGITVSNKDIPQVNFEEIIKFAIFGSDSRDQNNTYAGRSDTIILVVINNNNKSVNLISIPRDTYVNVPGYGMTKINHAYAYGREQLTLKTINSNFGLDIKQYMTIDFSGLISSIDRVGGVELTLDQAEVDFINSEMTAENKISGPGKITLNGVQALKHSRNRYVGNDFTRASRQRQILISLMQKLVKMDVNEILAISDDILVNITTNMDINSYKDMFLKVAADRQQYLQNVSSVQIPSTEYGYNNWIDGIYYYGFDIDRAKKDFQKYYYGIE